VYRSTLSHRDFRLLLGGQAISSVGDWLYSVALVVYVWERTRSPGWVALVSIVRLGAAALFGTFGGLVADRYDRRRVMLATDLTRALVMAVLGLVVASGASSAVVLAIACLSSVVSTVYRPASAALTPALVGEADLAAANALNETVENLALLIGPAAGGALLVVSSPQVAIGLNGLTFLVSGVLVALIRHRAPAAAGAGQGYVGRRLAEGVRAVTGSPDAALLVGLTVATAFVYGAESVLFVLVAEDRLGAGAAGIGFLLAAGGLGGLAAAGVAGRLERVSDPGRVLLLSSFMIGAPLVALALVRRPALAYALLTVEGFGGILFDVLATTLLQRTVPRDVLGRVFGILGSAAVSGMLLGSVVAPIVIGLAGVPAGLVVAGLTVPVLALVTLPRLSALSRSANRRRQELGDRAELLDRLRIFDGAPQTAVESVAAALVPESVQAGKVVIREGDPADDLFIVRSGQLEVHSTGEAGGDQFHVRTLGPGDYFGEIGLLERIPRTATVRAATGSELYRVDGQVFLEAVSQAVTLPVVLRLGVVHRLARTHPSRRAAAEQEGSV
jgi:CRP-like cAMP-binding protein/predicted MFS family arabinose efflux permease